VAPFTGYIEAVRAWIDDPSELALNVGILAIALTFAVLAFRSRLPIVWGALPFVPLTIVLSVNVLREPFDLSRILAPVLTAAPFLLAVRTRGTVPPETTDTFMEKA
jgi:hypothetical protein